MRFFTIAIYFIRLTRIDVPSVWFEEYEMSCQRLKEFLTITPVLTLPDEGEKFTMLDAFYDCLGVYIDAAMLSHSIYIEAVESSLAQLMA